PGYSSTEAVWLCQSLVSSLTRAVPVVTRPTVIDANASKWRLSRRLNLLCSSGRAIGT
ncbi:hypothetical protein ASPCADRAFT_143272, partial [Aspergillus carbonarius ITEM 5010]